MAAQSITTDQTTMTTFEAGATSTDFGGGQGSSDETDFYIQGSQSFSRKVSGTTAVVGFGITGTGPTVAGQHVYVWVINQTPGLVNVTTAGGVRVAIGSSGNAYDMFYVNGSEDLIGGWKCYPVDWQATPDASAGNPNSTDVVGALLSTNGTVNRNNLGIDAIRYGTGIDATGGGSPDPDLTFADISGQDSLVANQWGILQPTPSGVAIQGELRIGADDTSTPTTFNDIDAILTKPNNNPSGVNTNTSATFSGLTLQGSLTTATFTGCTFISLDNHDKGYVDAASATNGATGTFDGCTFSNWGTFDGRSTVTVTGGSFKSCGVFTLNGGTLDLSSFSNCSPVDAGVDLDGITNCDFTRGSGTHAITTSVNTGTISLVGNSFSGYGAAGQEAIEFTATTGSVQVNVSGGVIPSFTSAGVTVTFSLSSTLTLTGLETSPTTTKIVVYDAGTSTIVAQEASNVTGTFSASINVSSVDIILLNLSYEVIKLKNVDTTVDREIPIQQRTDRQYENP